MVNLKELIEKMAKSECDIDLNLCDYFYENRSDSDEEFAEDSGSDEESEEKINDETIELLGKALETNTSIHMLEATGIVNKVGQKGIG